VVETIFRKASKERIFCGFYAQLCSDIVAMELQMKGYEAKRVNIKHCNFRGRMLMYCRESFLEVFKMKEVMKQEQDDETRLKHKERLFGNIDFIGELYRNYLLPERIIFQIFGNLLGLDEQNPNEETLEAALNLINKVGSELQGRVLNNKAPKKPDEDKSVAEKEAEVYQRFEDFMEGTCEKLDTSQRIRLLLKNMLEDKKEGWKKNVG